jgi:ketosteroid isomerase-like protein
MAPYSRGVRLLTLLVCIFLAAAAAAQSKRSAIEADLKQMMSLFEGEFDNFAQVWEEKEQKAQYPHEHIHSIFARVALPTFGEHVFYVKQYQDGDPAKIYRTRLYTFQPNEAEQAIELRIYQFPDEKAVNDAHLQPAKLAGLAPEKMRATPGCEVYWKREGEDFHGYMKPTCRVNSQRLGKTIVITDNLKLSRDEIWINDQAKDTEGNYVFGNKSGVHHKLKRARYFDGWFALRKDGSRSTDEGKPEDYLSTRGLRIHNQGGRAALVGPNGEKTKYWVELAQLIQQTAKVEVLVLKIYEEGSDRAIAYTWTQPDAWRIGVNLRWIQTSFTMKKDEEKNMQVNPKQVAETLAVGLRGFDHFKHGLAKGEWQPFLDMLTDDFTFYFPSGKYQGLNTGKAKAVEFFSYVSTAFNKGLNVTEVMRVTANETTVVFEFRDEGPLRGELYKNRVAVSWDVRGDKISGYREYFGSDGKSN